VDEIVDDALLPVHIINSANPNPVSEIESDNQHYVETKSDARSSSHHHFNYSCPPTTLIILIDVNLIITLFYDRAGYGSVSVIEVSQINYLKFHI
jgi:hypothetical protein